MRDHTPVRRRAGLILGAMITLASLFTFLVPSAGAADPGIKQVEQKLNDLHYWPGAVDGDYDGDTAQAVMAFQKANGLSATGELTAEVADAVNSATAPPAPLVADGGPDRVEVDLSRQILMAYDGGLLAAVLNASTGTSRTPTNTGTFEVYRHVGGWDEGPLGNLYNPMYFDGGVAIHGSNSVPAHPASHGCVRISVNAAEWMPKFAPVGTPVYVMGASAGVAPKAPPASSGASAPSAPSAPSAANDPSAGLTYTPITFTPR